MSETKSVLTVWNVESPLKNVDELAVPDPSLAVGTVPDAMFDAFNEVKLAPLPVKLDAVTIPIESTFPLDDIVIPIPVGAPILKSPPTVIFSFSFQVIAPSADPASAL